MRILLANNSPYYPSFGGGDKSNRLLMEALAARGHDVRVVARVANSKFLADLEARGVHPKIGEDAVQFVLGGVDVRTLTRNPQLRAYFSAQLAEFDPDVILTSTDDPAQLLFEVASRARRARVVYLVRATIAVPFGPDSSSPNRAKTEMLRRADGIVGVSEYVAGICPAMERLGCDPCSDFVDGAPGNAAARALRQSVRGNGESLRGEGHLDFSCTR